MTRTWPLVSAAVVAVVVAIVLSPERNEWCAKPRLDPRGLCTAPDRSQVTHRAQRRSSGHTALVEGSIRLDQSSIGHSAGATEPASPLDARSRHVQIHPVPDDFAANARIKKPTTKRCTPNRCRIRKDSGAASASGWTGSSRTRKVKDVSFDAKDLHIRWYHDGELNVSANCLDRHLAKRGDKTAIIWEGDDPNESRRISYRELHAEVCSAANLLKNLGVSEGRSRHDLSADDSGSGGRDARVRAHRRGAFGRVRRLLAGFAGRPHRRFDIANSSSPPTKACAAARRCR